MGALEYTEEQLAEAKRQIDSTLHKLRQTVKTFEGKAEPSRYRSQLTLARRRIEAFSIAAALIEQKLQQGCPPDAAEKEQTDE